MSRSGAIYGLGSLATFHTAAAAGSFLVPSNYTFGGPSSAALTASRLLATPLFLPTSTNIDQIAAEVTTLGAGSTVRMGIYRGSANAPTTLLVDAGTVATAAAGVVTVAAVQTLGAGFWWLALVEQGGTPPVMMGCNGQPPRLVAFPPSTTPPDNLAALRHNAGVAGALPATFTVDPVNPNDLAPLLMVRTA